MKTLKEILNETNVSAGTGVRGFGDVTGTPATTGDSENSHIVRVVQGADENNKMVKSFVDTHNTSSLLDEPDSDNWWAKAGAKGSALTALGKPVKSSKTINENNTSSGGAIASMGVTSPGKPANWGEPGVSLSKTKYKKENERQTPILQDKILRRLEQPMFQIEQGKFAGNKTFIVPDSVFHEARMSKKKGAHWTKYLNETDYGRAIREYANKNPKKPIILQCEKTGYMCYARYGSK